MQATVRSFNAETRSGTVLLDDGLELPYESVGFDAGGLRLLRVGQRVRMRLEGEPRRITFLTVTTLPDPR